MPRLLGLLFAAGSTAALAGEEAGSEQTFLDAVTVTGVRDHQRALQAIADANAGTRASGTTGYDRSADYVAEALASAGYSVLRQTFGFTFYQDLTPPLLEQLEPRVVQYPPDAAEGVFTLTYSGSAEVTGTVQGVDLVLPPGPDPGTSNSGCEPEDFADFIPGNVALLQRGTCSFLAKASNAALAGASAVIIFNEGQPERTAAISGTLGEATVDIPVVNVSFATGTELAAAPLARVHLVVDALREERSTENVIADSGCGSPEHTVVVGAHLDSVLEGAGSNDNGSGSATVLTIAEQFARLPCETAGLRLQSRVRFAFWGAEESGVLGSEHYLETLPEAELAQLALNLNFDMLGSPNYVRFVYDGDGIGTDVGGPPGSEQIERVLVDYFAARGLESAPTALDGRSDYGGFIDRGIPAGGLFSGAEDIKTAEEAALFGGTAGVAHDACYHAACDDLNNVSLEILDQMSDAAAHAVLTFASRAQPIAPALPSADAALARSLPLRPKAAPARERRGARFWR